jgi:hypothetical protein
MASPLVACDEPMRFTQDHRYDVGPEAFGDYGDFLAFSGDKHGLVVGLQSIGNEF